jgi:RimJ/RimL family protein N-acetyltransferase
MDDPTEVRTTRLRLRRLEPADLDAVATLQADPETTRLRPGGSSRAESAALLDEWVAHWTAHGFGYWAIEPSDPTGPDRLIGIGGLQHRHRDGDHYLNVYYRITPGAWGHGYAPEVVTAAVTWATAALPDLPIMIITNTDNHQARRVADKTGFIEVKQDLYSGAPAVFLRYAGPRR